MAGSTDFAMIDMGDDVPYGDTDDSETDIHGEGSTQKPTTPDTDKSGWPFSGENLQDNLKLASSMSSMVQRGKQAWSIYGNIDILRPYFDVEPYEVLKRLCISLIPLRPSGRHKVARELYGPLMVSFTLIALLLFQMKSSDHTVEEGTLMGTAFGVCFTYWVGASSLVWFLSFVCNCSITYVQILSMMGYALFGHCIVLLSTTLFHTAHDHVFFYVMWGVVGGLSALRMVTVLTSRTHGGTQRIIICSVVAALHLLYLLYLHFAYHQIVEEISDALGQAHPDTIVKNTIPTVGDTNINLKLKTDTLLNKVVPHITSPLDGAVVKVMEVAKEVVTVATDKVVTIATGNKVVTIAMGNHNLTATI